MSAAEKPLAVSTIDGKYALIRELGSGSTGTVYEAENLIVGKKIALKLMKRECFPDSNSQARFLAEARAAARISHANVVDIHDLGITQQGVPFVVMELLRGETLADMMETHGPLAPGFTCELLLQLLAGLSAAHAQGIVHGDLKPSNIFVTHPRPDRPLVKVLDFGIAPGVHATQQRERASLPSPVYLAPEQVGGEPADFRSDVYQAGAVLFALLCGSDPFEGASSRDVLELIAKGKPKDLRALVPELSPQLVQVIEDAMALEPKERIQSAEELAERVRSFVAPSHLLAVSSPSVRASAKPFALIVSPTPVAVARSSAPAREGTSVIPVDMPRVARVNHSLLVSPRIPRAPTAPKLLMGQDFLPMPGDPEYQEITESHRSPTHAPRRGSSFRRDMLPALVATAIGFGLGVVLAWSAGLL